MACDPAYATAGQLPDKRAVTSTLCSGAELRISAPQSLAIAHAQGRIEPPPPWAPCESVWHLAIVGLVVRYSWRPRLLLALGLICELAIVKALPVSRITSKFPGLYGVISLAGITAIDRPQ